MNLFMRSVEEVVVVVVDDDVAALLLELFDVVDNNDKAIHNETIIMITSNGL